MSLLHGIANFLPNRRTRLIVPAVALGIVIVALFTPSDESGNSMDGRLSSFLSGPNGAKGFHDAAKRLGWRTERKKISPFDSIPAGTIVAVLAPPQELSERETGILLQNVRAGASLLTVVTSGSALADSLNLVPARGMIDLPVILPVNPHCRAGEPRSAYQLMGDKTFVTPFSKPTRLGPGSQAFVMVRDVDDSRLTRFAAIGFPLEKGRVVAVSDANVMRNDFIRVCKWGIGPSTIQMLQFLSNGRQPADTRLIFDEFHLGFGPQPSVARAAGRVLFGTAPGATLVQIIVAAGILLLAVAPRPPALGTCTSATPVSVRARRGLVGCILSNFRYARRYRTPRSWFAAATG